MTKVVDKSVLVFLVIVINCDYFSKSEDVHVFPYKSLEQCKRNERYDIDMFQCVECDSKNGWLVPSPDRLSCVCQPNTFEDVIYDSVKAQSICKVLNCKSCSAPKQPDCKIKYINSKSINDTNQKSIQIFYDDSKNCSCDTKTNIPYHDFCISNPLLKNFHHFSTFHPERAIYSNLKFIAFFCKVLRNSTACNHLANLCISSSYSLAKNSPCSLFYVSQASDAAVYTEDDMENRRPFVFYRKARSTQKELAKTIDFTFELGKKKESMLQLVALTYSLDGRLIRIGNFFPHYVNLCSRNVVSNYNGFKFAYNFESSCKFTLNQLVDMSMSTRHFYSVYLNYTIDSVQYLQQIPVLIRNAFKFNEGDNPSDWQLVKRFQIYDFHEISPISTHMPLTYDHDSSKLTQFKMIRYIDSFQMTVKIRDGNRISTPLLILHYKTIYIDRNSSLSSEYKHKFSVTFERGHDLDFYFEIILPLLVAIGFAFAILRTFNYKTRRNREYYDLPALCQFVLYLFSNCANAMFSVVGLLCFYVFFMYTGQGTVTVLVPIPQQDLMDVLIGVGVTLKGIYFIFHFWRIVHADIFFIDWERPRGYDSLSTHRSNLDTPSVCSSVRSVNSDAVSAWRNFFVANEWIKISNKRKSSIFFQNIVFLLALDVTSANINSLRETKDRTLSLALIMLLHLIIYGLQICINYMFIERIFVNPLQQFIDVCSTANISVFLLLHDSYGFYLHGRSPHGFSDVDMSSIIIQLQRESQNMCGKRGLLTGSDDQNYIMLVPTDLRMYYTKLLTPYQRAASLSQSHFEKEFSQSKNPDYSLERTTAAYNNINKFFCAFIDHSIKDLDYIVKERSFMEVLLNCEFDSYLSETKGTFYVDNYQSFGKMLLYGNDSQLFLWNLMLFCLVFVISESPVLSAFVTSLIDQGFRAIFRRLIKSNVAKKTLIDSRFLI